MLFLVVAISGKEEEEEGTLSKKDCETGKRKVRGRRSCSASDKVPFLVGGRPPFFTAPGLLDTRPRSDEERHRNSFYDTFSPIFRLLFRHCRRSLPQGSSAQKRGAKEEGKYDGTVGN